MRTIIFWILPITCFFGQLHNWQDKPWLLVRLSSGEETFSTRVMQIEINGRHILEKLCFCIVIEALEFLWFPLNSPHTLHKDSIEAPSTPDTTHFFQARNTQLSSLRGRNKRERPTCTNMQSLLRHVTYMCTQACGQTHTLYAPRYFRTLRASLQFWGNWDLLFHNNLSYSLWKWFRSDSPGLWVRWSYYGRILAALVW